METTVSKLVIAGGSGFLGGVLSEWFADRGWEVVVVARRAMTGAGRVRFARWDGEGLGDWVRELEGAAGVINLAGRSVDCRYTATNRREIMESRVKSTRVLRQAIGQCADPPGVWLNASTATIYKHSLDRAMDEVGEIAATPEAKDAFSVAVATGWEKEFFAAPVSATRRVAMRTAMVLGLGKNSVFPVLRRLVRLRLGGKMGSGRQFVSWIHRDDFCCAVAWLMEHEEITGIVNLAAPNPVTNEELMRTLREVCGVRLGLPATRWMLEVGAFVLRTETELIIKSRRVVPARLTASGFTFQFPEIRGAMENLIGRSHHRH